MFYKPTSCKYLLFLLSIITFSCSKDSDLLSEFVIGEQITGIDDIQLLDDVYTINAIETDYIFNVLDNDNLPNTAEVKIIETTAPEEGDLKITNDSLLSYTPIVDSAENAGNVVVDQFTYTVIVTNDGETTQEKANVTVNTHYGGEDMGGLKAFPIAYGPGSIATGGRGKTLAIIDTLDPYASLIYHPGDSSGNDEYYTGGFLTALQRENIGYVVFNVSGDLQMGKAKGWYAGFKGVNNKTIFGQSAPEGGITLTERSVRFDGRFGDNKNLIFRYLRSRPIYNQNGIISTDDDAFTWGLMFYGGENIVVDHCSFSFAQDKALGAYIDESHVVNGSGLRNITFQHNFIQDSNTGGYVEINPNRDGNPEELVDAISWHNNIFSGVNRTPNLAFNGRAEKINNIIHNTPSKNTSVYHSLQLNSEGNYYQLQSTTADKVRVDVNDFTSGNPSIYTSSNFFKGTVGGSSISLSGSLSEDNSKMWSTLNVNILAPSSYFTDTRHEHGFSNPVPVLSAQEAFDLLVNKGNVGAFKYIDNDGYVRIYRDSFDTSQLSIVANNRDYQSKNSSSWVLPKIPYNTRPDSYDTDNDGMSDAWEIRTFGDLQQSYRDDFDGDGYTNIEEFMAQVDFDD